MSYSLDIWHSVFIGFSLPLRFLCIYIYAFNVFIFFYILTLPMKINFPPTFCFSNKILTLSHTFVILPRVSGESQELSADWCKLIMQSTIFVMGSQCMYKAMLAKEIQGDVWGVLRNTLLFFKRNIGKGSLLFLWPSSCLEITPEIAVVIVCL